MRSNSGKDESRDNLHDPTLRDRTEQRTKTSDRSPSHMPRRRPIIAKVASSTDLADPVVSSDSVERERQDQLAGPRRPAERGFRIAHSFPGADHAPKDVGETGPGAGDCRVEAALRVDLRAGEIEPSLPGRARPAPHPTPSSRAALAVRAPSRPAAARPHHTGAASQSRGRTASQVVIPSC